LAEDSPVEAPKVPEGHGVGAEAPELGQYDPIGQKDTLTDPVAQYVPGGHSAGWTEPEAAKRNNTQYA
jgi:hypothetical protein